jgi:hypothetical protein
LFGDIYKEVFYMHRERERERGADRQEKGEVD